MENTSAILRGSMEAGYGEEELLRRIIREVEWRVGLVRRTVYGSKLSSFIREDWRNQEILEGSARELHVVIKYILYCTSTESRPV